MTTIATFNRSSEKTNIWLRDALDQLDWTDPHRAYTALRAVLHAVRDHLPHAEMAQLAAELPTFIRGVYYEGWSPVHTPAKERGREVFLSQIRDAFRPRADVDPEQVARAIIRLLLDHVSHGEMEQVRNSLPHDIREFWPKDGTTRLERVS